MYLILDFSNHLSSRWLSLWCITNTSYVQISTIVITCCHVYVHSFHFLYLILNILLYNPPIWTRIPVLYSVLSFIIYYVNSIQLYYTNVVETICIIFSSFLVVSIHWVERNRDDLSWPPLRPPSFLKTFVSSRQVFLCLLVCHQECKQH